MPRRTRVEDTPEVIQACLNCTADKCRNCMADGYNSDGFIAGGKLAHNNAKQEERDREILEQYKRGTSTAEIRQIYHLSKTTIARVRKKYGIVLQPKTGRVLSIERDA